jgi:peptide-methionine (S)-S-oxide reductase
LIDVVDEGATGHAEAVRISDDPRQVSYGRLLQIHFEVAHNPMELNRQGPDVGTQYRSTVFPVNAAQARVAKNHIAQFDKAKRFGQPIATTGRRRMRRTPAAG